MATFFSIWMAIAAIFIAETPVADIPVTDIDGNVYQTAQIGNRIWMASDLKTSRYRNGDSIPYVQKNEAWKNLTSGALSYVNNDAATGINSGKLYNWYAVNDPRGLCPDGWHIPTDEEWKKLSDFLGGEKIAGTKLKPEEKDNSAQPSTNSGFNAAYSGYRSFAGKYLFKDDYCGLWSSTEAHPDFAWVYYVNKYNERFSCTFLGKKNGVSCRCIKD